LQPQLKGYLAITAAAALWGFAGAAVRYVFVARGADPITLVQFRMTLTCLITGVALAVSRPGMLRVRRSDYPLLALYGIGGLSLAQVAYYWAIREGNVATAIFLQYLAPLLTALYEIVVLHRKPRGVTYGVLTLALGGLLLLVLGRPAGALATTWIGVSAGLLAAVGMACHTIAGRHGVSRYNPWTVLFWGTAMGSVVWAIVQPPWVLLTRPWAPADWLFFLYLALLSSTIPFGLYLIGLSRVGPTSAAVTATLEPVCASIWAFVLLGETLSALQIGGCILILGAVVTVQALPGAALVDTLAKPETPPREEAASHG
jgi:drug/metabolite transporter (DMT)-like permease